MLSLGNNPVFRVVTNLTSQSFGWAKIGSAKWKTISEAILSSKETGLVLIQREQANLKSGVHFKRKILANSQKTEKL